MHSLFKSFCRRGASPAFLLPLVLMVPSVALRWQSHGQGVRITVDQGDEHIAQCVQGGLEVRYRVEIKSCREHGGWFDRCGESSLITRTIMYDPVSESYQISTDIIDDSFPPSLVVETDADEAEKKLRDFSIASIAEIVRPDGADPDDLRHFLKVRVRGYCQRDDQSWIAQIPYHLTLGFFQYAGFDTGWNSYELTGQGAESAE